MIELEIQALSERRQGLLVEIGHFVIATGFTLQRQRLIQDPHGVLLTMVVRGPARKKRALEAALDADERIISFQLTPFVDGAHKPHFAASRTLTSYVPAPMPEPEPAVETRTIPTPDAATTPATASAAFDRTAPARLTSTPASTPAPVREAAPAPDFEFILPEPQSTPPFPPSVLEEAFVERVPLEPDLAAIDRMLAMLDSEYPQIMPRLLTLARSVAEASREPSLRLAGQRIGCWVSEHKSTQAATLDLNDAIKQIGIPTLQALVEVEQEGTQVHIRNSPLCSEGSHSGCTFFSGVLEGVLGPVLASSEVTIFPVCCCSYGADDCVLALSN